MQGSTVGATNGRPYGTLLRVLTGNWRAGHAPPLQSTYVGADIIRPPRTSKPEALYCLRRPLQINPQPKENTGKQAEGRTCGEQMYRYIRRAQH